MEQKIISKYQNTKQFFYGFRKVFLKNEKLPLEARFLIVLLFTYKGKNQYAWPSQGELARRLNRSRDTVRKYLKHLQKKGYLRIKSRGIGRSLFYAPSYMSIYAGSQSKSYSLQKPDEAVRQRPDKTSRHRSINPGNKEAEEAKKQEIRKRFGWVKPQKKEGGNG